MSIYTKEYFIAKFEAIPTMMIGTGSLENCCALYHCGVKETSADPLAKRYVTTEEAVALNALLDPLIDQAGVVNYSDAEIANVWRVNDGSTNLKTEVWESTHLLRPRERMLAALRMLP